MLPTLLLAAIATAQAPADDQHAVDEAIAALKKTEAAIRDLSVTTDYVTFRKKMLRVQQPVQTRFRVEIVATAECEGWADFHGETVARTDQGIAVHRSHIRRTFDGTVERTMTGDADPQYRLDGGWQLGEIDNAPPVWDGIFPFEFTTESGGQPISKVLAEFPPVLAGRAEWQGRPIVILETRPTVNGGAAFKARFEIDPGRGVVVRRATQLQHEPGRSPWKDLERTETFDHKEIAPGIWLPTRFTLEVISLGRGGEPDELMHRFEGRNANWNVNQNPPASRFELTFPAGVQVIDHRRPAIVQPIK
jgi:hypothetical protein